MVGGAMESEQSGAAPATVEPSGDEAVWSRAWEWPAWMRPPLPVARGRRPGRGTLAVLVLVFFVPGLIGGLGNLGTNLDFARGVGASGGLLAVPSWLRLYYSAQVGLTATAAVIVLGALLLLIWRRAGTATLALGALADAAGHVTVLVAYLRSHEAPAGSIAEVVAEVVSRLLLVGLALLLLQPHAEAAAPRAEEAFAPPAP
jgi:hypothetical protein